MIEKRLWSNQHPLRQFGNLCTLTTTSISPDISHPAPVILDKLEKLRLSVDKIRELSASDLSGFLKNRIEAGKAVRTAAYNIPRLEVSTELSPITRTIVLLSFCSNLVSNIRFELV